MFVPPHSSVVEDTENHAIPCRNDLSETVPTRAHLTRLTPGTLARCVAYVLVQPQRAIRFDDIHLSLAGRKNILETLPTGPYGSGPAQGIGAAAICITVMAIPHQAAVILQRVNNAVAAGKYF